MTLGACGRTLPLTDDNLSYVDVPGDDDTGSGGTGDTTSVGGAHTGGTNSGGTGARGGSGNGGTQTNGGTGGNVGVGGSAASGGSGGDIAPFGGTGDRGAGGSVSRGGSGGTGGSSTGGRAAGGRGVGGRNSNGGMGALAGSENAAGAPSMFPDITCDDFACDPATSVCCKRRGSPSTCETLVAGCSSGATLNCSGNGQCGPTQVCCFHFNSSTCADSCNVSVGSPGNPPTVLLCDSNADCPTDQICVVAPRGIAYCASAVQ